MLKEVHKPFEDVGIIVARFQVAELHEGHTELIDTVFNRHDKVIIFLGLSVAKSTSVNPLDFESRKNMLLEAYPKAIIMYIKDQGDDAVWSKKLDEQINDLITPSQTAVLYGSRDSFLPHYLGKYNTRELTQNVFTSGTDSRKKISNNVKCSKDFRWGVIWAVTNQYPAALPTVDVAIFSSDKKQILLARKPNETAYRFVGGFVEPGHNFEQTVRKEVSEETHLEVDDLQYITSAFIDDWRYRSEKSKIVTALFAATIQYGRPTPDDDVEEVRYFDIKHDGGIENFPYIDLEGETIVENHKPLMEAVVGYLIKKDMN